VLHVLLGIKHMGKKKKKSCDVMIPNIYPLGITKKKWAFQKAKYSPFQRNKIMQ
jgi:hypothetical protein